ncbi:hypothetical protein BDZ89DRAFT_1077365 [Hymenopellis radicata]|nr:hypothetical protein BDZ89DRAFT_1077365 [Hymenopellis radicata]
MSNSPRSSSYSSSPEPGARTHREKFFDFNPPPLIRPRPRPVPVPSAPLHFLDSHLSESLILKHVEVLPSMHVELFHGLVDSFSEALDARSDSLFQIDGSLPYRNSKRTDAISIRNMRELGIEMPLTRIASSLVVHPSQPRLGGALSWSGAPRDTRPYIIDQPYASQDIALYVSRPHPEEYGRFSAKNRDIVERLYRHTRQLTSSMVFCTDALPVLEDMSRLHGMKFPWRLDCQYSGASRPRSPPPDASDVPWTLPKVEGPRRSSRVRAHDASRRIPVSQDIGVLTPSRDEGGEYTPVCEDYVQKAWVTAVKVDATFIIFDCGNFIRIGIRHRERQTLLLSSLIDIRSCKDPAYGGLWTAFHVFAIADAVQRLPLIENSLLTKRKSTFDEPRRPSKRLKPDDGAADMSSIDKTMAAYMDKFPVLAIFFRFDHLDSPAPRLLFKPDAEHRSHYGPTQYLKIIAYKRLGAGAVGDVYQAVIEPDNISNTPKASSKTSKKKAAKGSEKDLTHRPFVLKIAPTDARARRLQHEVCIYRHLHDAGVSGIPSLLSYREALNSDMRVLMLSDAGRPLGQRMDSERKIELSPKARVELKSILTAIHEAGVLHRDVRSWNIMEDDSGRVRFTDFDRSSLRGKPEDYQAEQERLDRFVEGEYVDKGDIIGEDDVRRPGAARGP